MLRFYYVILSILMLSACATKTLQAPCNNIHHQCQPTVKINEWAA